MPLNIEAPIPEGLSEEAESVVTDMVIEQKEGEIEYYQKHKNNQRYVTIIYAQVKQKNEGHII